MGEREAPRTRPDVDEDSCNAVADAHLTMVQGVFEGVFKDGSFVGGVVSWGMSYSVSQAQPPQIGSGTKISDALERAVRCISLYNTAALEEERVNVVHVEVGACSCAFCVLAEHAPRVWDRGGSRFWTYHGTWNEHGRNGLGVWSAHNDDWQVPCWFFGLWKDDTIVAGHGCVRYTGKGVWDLGPRVYDLPSIPTTVPSADASTPGDRVLADGGTPKLATPGRPLPHASVPPGRGRPAPSAKADGKIKAKGDDPKTSRPKSAPKVAADDQ